MLSFTANAQLNADPESNATALAQAMSGPGVTVMNATLTCPSSGAGFFTAESQSLGISNGIVLTTGSAFDIKHPNNGAGSSFDGGACVVANLPGDPQLQSLAGNSTHDACILQFDVIPQGDTLRFDYIFASEEYNEFVNSSFNDVFAFFISGPGIPGQQNIARIPGTNLPVTINNVNCGSFSQYYICNDPHNPTEGNCNTADCPPFSDPWDPEYDGLTTVLTARAIVQPCQTYHMKLAIADVGDGAFDSGVFLKQGSLTSAAITASPDGSICPGEQYPMSVNNVSANASINWSPADGLSCATCQNTTASPASTTTYTVVVSYGPGCSSSEQVVVNVGPGVNASLNATASNCAVPTGAVTTSVSSGVNPLSFLWSNGATTQNLSNVWTGNYSVTITDAQGCTASYNSFVGVVNGPSASGVVTNSTCTLPNGSINLAASGGEPPYAFNWSNGPQTEDATNLPAGSYFVTVTDAQGCVFIDTFNITTTTVPVISSTTVNAICTAPNGSIDVTINEGTAPYAYAWTNGATSQDLNNVVAAPYTLTVTDVLNCSSVSTIELQADGPPPLLLSGLKDSVCVGSAFTARASGYDNYVWSPDTGLNMVTGDSVLVTVTANQTYSVIGTDANGCIDTVGFDVTSVPYAEVEYASTFNGCEPLSVALVTDPVNAKSVEWWVDGAIVSTSFETTRRFFAGLHDGMLVAVSPIGCNDTVTMPGFIDVLVTPNAAFNHHHDAATGSLFIFNFTNLTTDNDATSYAWNFGDGSSDFSTHPTHTFPDYGSYPVLLTATNDNGCWDTALHIVDVVIPHDVFIPNTITPNGDGNNETFHIYGLGIRAYRMQVFDRLGELVYEGTSSDRGWDGTFKGQQLNAGTFVYVADVEFLDNRQQRFWGDINVLR